MNDIKERLCLLSDSPHTDSLSILSSLNPIVEELISSSSDPTCSKRLVELLTGTLSTQNPLLSSTVLEILSIWRSFSGESSESFIQEFLYQLPRVSYPGTLVSAIGRLRPAKASSTYLSILRHCPTSWPWVLDEIQKSDFGSLAPLFAQILLDPSPSIHLTSFRVALREHLILKNEAASQYFIAESIQWLSPSPENRVWIHEIVQKMSPEERISMYASLTIDKVSSGMDPTALLSQIREELKTYKGPNNVLSSVLIMLTNAFDKAFFGHYLSFLEVMRDLFDVVSDKWILGIFISSLLGITLVPSKLLPKDLWRMSSSLIKKYNVAKPVSDSSSNLWKETTRLVWNRDINMSRIKTRLLSEFSDSNDSIVSWLKGLKNISLEYLCILKSLFLGSSSDVVLNGVVAALASILIEYPQRSHGVLAVILHKLSKETNPRALNVTLKSLSIVVKDKNCIKFVVKIADSLSNMSHLAAIKLKLLYDLYEAEERTYPYLHKALEEKTSNDEAHISKAFIIYKICSNKSSVKHASDLLPLLSEILNDQAHELSCLLSLKAIHSMCSDSIIDIETTLKAIMPKVLADGQTEVRVALLDVCALLPDFQVESEKYEAFFKSTLKFLWSLTKKCQENPMALRRAAYKCIGKYGLYKQRFELLPTTLTNGFDPIELVENDESILYVPGECWLNMLIDSSEEDLPLYEGLLKTFLEDEVREFPSSVYYLPHKNNEKTRMDYSSVLSESSVLRYLIASLQSSHNPLGLEIYSSIFRILSAQYFQQFPPLNWDLLLPFQRKYETEVFCIVVHQIRKSHCAIGLIERVLDSDISVDLTVAILSKIDILLQYHRSHKLKAFLLKISGSCIDKTPLTCILKGLREKASVCSKYEDFNEFFKSLLHQVSCDDQLMDLYLELIPHFPHEHWKQLSNPLLLKKITEQSLRNSLKIRRILSSKDSCSLIWFNDIIEALISESIDFDPSEMISGALLESLRDSGAKPEACRRWLNDYMGLILSFVRRKNPCVFPVLFQVFMGALSIFCGHSDYFLCAPKCGPSLLLPSAIQFVLSSREKPWSSFGVPLGEWLLSLLRDERIHSEPKQWIRSSLSSFKYGSDFDQICIKLVMHFYECN